MVADTFCFLNDTARCNHRVDSVVTLHNYLLYPVIIEELALLWSNSGQCYHRVDSVIESSLGSKIMHLFF